MKKTRNNAGETLVEVMASMVIFLLLVAVLQGAVMYSHAAMEKSRKIRADNEAICESLRTTQVQTSGSQENMQFQAVSADGSIKGNLVFQVPVMFGEKDVSYTDSEGRQKLVTFYLYAAMSQGDDSDGQTPESPGEGGGT